jgi:DNA-binding NarL/FixJ family response regulator
MPVLDGIEVLKLIWATDLIQPVIILTGDDNPETERLVRALGVSEFILKGVSLVAVTDVLAQVLKTSAPRMAI